MSVSLESQTILVGELQKRLEESKEREEWERNRGDKLQAIIDSIDDFAAAMDDSKKVRLDS